MRQFAIITKYTKSHEWIAFDTDTNTAKIGITNHAQKELGDIVHVDMPDIGDKFSILDSLVSVESVKTAADVYAMVDAEVVAVNEGIEDDAGVVNSSPQDEGWMVEVKCDKKQLDNLLSQEQYDELL